MSLQDFGPGIWLAEGTPVTGAAGFRFPIRMAVLRLAEGGLVLWSPVQAAPGLVASVAALGPVRALVAPNRLHHSFLSDWAAAFPEAAILAAPGLAVKRPDLRIAAEIGESLPPDWAGHIEGVLVGNSIAPEVVLYHRESRTVLICDLLQNMARDWFHGWRGLVARLDRMVGPEPAMPRKFRLASRGAGAALQRVADWPAERVVVAHGTPVARDGQAFLRRALAGIG
ncbi:DUF4336 domain-containing protein [Pararhodobacter sp.]|uniref:DUF4336 domain-containing protein n=1 Tax=Pararhodobacter sp. TaxID=2127056 RepID=UPI002FE0DA43